MSELDAYCRAVEAHLCRRNQGHLIRLVGPAFVLARQWAERGIPLTVVESGIDRTVDRAARRDPMRRRPLRLEFCEADVLDAFDDWRRAVGVPVTATAEGDDVAAQAASPAEPVSPTARRASLATHIERALAQLTLQRGSTHPLPGLAAALADAVTVLDGLQATARRARGEAREQVIATLAEHDVAFGRAVMAAVPPDERAVVRAQVEQDLAPFRARMATEAFARALEAAEDGVWRQRLGLPRLAFD